MSESKRQNEWNSNLEQVKTFAANNKRWPSTTSEDSSEKSLGQWWSRQKYLINKKAETGKDLGLTPEKEALIKGLIEANSSLERDGVWDSRYQMVVEKYKAEQKLWSYSSENADEQKSIRWWNQQKTFARKFKLDPSKSHGGMTQNRYDKIISLMRVMGQNLEEVTVVADSASPI